MSTGVSLADFSAVKLALMAQEARAQTAQVLRADPIAIVGMACRTPGGVRHAESLLATCSLRASMTRAKFPPIVSIPRRGTIRTRLCRQDADHARRLPDAVLTCSMRTISAFFPARPNRWIPSSAWRWKRRSRRSTTPAHCHRERCAAPVPAVFMACYHSDYARLCSTIRQCFDTRTLTGSVHGVVANRISHFLDLRGPSLTLDTGCSSSLVAVHLACQSLRLGESDFVTRRRRIGNDYAGTLRRHDEGRLHGAGRPTARRSTLGRRLRPRRGLRHRCSEASQRCGRGWRPHAWP